MKIPTNLQCHAQKRKSTYRQTEVYNTQHGKLNSTIRIPPKASTTFFRYQYFCAFLNNYTFFHFIFGKYLEISFFSFFLFIFFVPGIFGKMGIFYFFLFSMNLFFLSPGFCPKNIINFVSNFLFFVPWNIRTKKYMQMIFFKV